MSYNPNYENINSVFAQAEPKAQNSGREEPATTINNSTFGTKKRAQTGDVPNSSYTVIRPDQEVRDDIRMTIDSDQGVLSFGGLLFRGKNGHNCDVLGYAVEDMSREDAQKVGDGRYFDLTTNYSEIFLTYDRSWKSGNHVVFTFRLPRGYHSLRELLDRPKSPECGEIIFRRLVKLIAHYEEVTKDVGGYKPLCCISLDTVFINKSSNNVKIAPIQAYNHNYPTYYPGEAGKEVADQRTDLYTAALTALQFMSSVEMETNENKMADCADIPAMDDCLRVFQSRRPDLQTVLATLKQSGSEDPNADNFNNGSFVDEDGNFKTTGRQGVSLAEFLRRHWANKKQTPSYAELNSDED